MAARSDLKETVLADFRAGIHNDWFAGSGEANTPDGAAQLSGTYGCVSDPTGGLIPGPKRVHRVTQALIDANTGGTRYPAGDGNLHITAFRAVSPVFDRTGLGANDSGVEQVLPDILAVGLEWFYAAGGTPFNHKAKLRVYKMFKETALAPNGAAAGSTYDAGSAVTGAAFASGIRYGWCGIDLSRTNKASATSPGYPFVGMSFTSNREVTTEVHVAYPDNDTPGTDSAETMAGLSGFGGFAAYALLGHQDRMLALIRSVNIGLGTDGELPTEAIIAAAVNDYSTNNIGPQQYVAENPSGFGSWMSMNASELFFVKQIGGGVVLRGAIDFPTVIRLPGIVPTYDAVNLGCISRDGLYVYGSRAGVFGWSGGDTSIPLSGKLDGWFWNVSGITGMDRLGYIKGSFAGLEKYVYAPNNFMLDVETGGWWRLANPSSDPLYCWHQVSAAGYVIAAPGTTTTTLADYYDPHQGQGTWQWKSQPLNVSRGRVLSFHNISIMVKGHGTVVVTLEGVTGATGSHTFTVDSDKWVAFDTSVIAMRATHDVVVTILSTGSSTNPGPSVKRLILRHSDRATAR